MVDGCPDTAQAREGFTETGVLAPSTVSPSAKVCVQVFLSDSGKWEPRL